jgi:cytochrome c oxidase cbb3-type subunit 3
MPEWQTKLGNERIMLLAAYVYSLSDKTAQPAKAAPATTEVPETAEATAN